VEPEGGLRDQTSEIGVNGFVLSVFDRLTLVSNLPPDPVIEAYKAGIDRTLLRESLKRTPDERLRKLMELQRVAEELRRAGRKLREGK